MSRNDAVFAQRADRLEGQAELPSNLAGRIEELFHTCRTYGKPEVYSTHLRSFAPFSAWNLRFSCVLAAEVRTIKAWSGRHRRIWATANCRLASPMTAAGKGPLRCLIGRKLSDSPNLPLSAPIWAPYWKRGRQTLPNPLRFRLARHPARNFQHASADGKRFLINVDTSANRAPPINVVLNWVAALNR